MRTYLLNGLWQLNGNGFSCEGKIPGSVLSFLLDNKLIDDPFYRDNEDKAFAVLNNEYDFSREFELTEIQDEMFLCCDGLDTLATIYLNDKLVAKTKNMHRAYRFDVTKLLKAGTNKIVIHFDPADDYIKAKDKEERDFFEETSLTIVSTMFAMLSFVMIPPSYFPSFSITLRVISATRSASLLSVMGVLTPAAAQLGTPQE